MNILFLTQVLPYPLDAGPKVRAYYVLRYLAQYHRVTLVSFTRASDTPAAVAHLREICEAVHCIPMPRSRLLDAKYLAKSLVTGRSFIIERDWLPAMAQFLQPLAVGPVHFDAIHADQLWMTPYAFWIQQLVCRHQPAARTQPLLVLDQHNAVYKIPERMAQQARNPLKRMLLQLEARKLAQFEVETCVKFPRVTWVTEEDYGAVQAQARPQHDKLPNAGIIPICLDPEGTRVVTPSATAHRVTFLGGLHYPPNAEGVLWFANEVFPQVLRAVPDAVLTVIGKQPPAQLQSCGIPERNLDVTGYVNDPTPLLAESAASIVPLHAGGGMRVKILDAWSKAIPVVSTTVGAEGIEVTSGKNILIADSPTAFAQATIHLLQQPDFARQIAHAGRQQALQVYNWRTRYQAWDRVYCQM